MKNFKKVLSFLKPYWLWALLGPLSMVVEVIMDLNMPRLLQKAVDKGIANNDTGLVIKIGLTMLAVSVFGWFGGALCTYFSTKASISMGADLRERLFKKVIGFSFKNLDKYPTGHLITRLTNDVEQTQNIVLMGLRVMVRVPLLIIGSVIMAYLTSPRLSVVILAAVPVLILSVVIVMKKAFPIYKVVQGNLDNVNKVVQENLSGMRAIKAFVRDKFEIDRFSSANEKLKDKMVEAGKIVAAEMPFILFIMNISIVAVLYLGGSGVVAGNVAIGQIVAFINYLQMMLMSLMMFAMLLVMLTRSSASINRIGALLEEEIDIKTEKGSRTEVEEGNITFSNVSFNYGLDEDALNNVNFSIKKGETVAILGSTGSGKSTLIHMLSRFYDVDRGSIEIDGVDIRDYDLNGLRKSIGVVLQNTTLFSGSIKDNISFGNSNANMEMIEEAAKASCAHDFILQMKNGYHTHLGQQGVNLSGGQKQRIAIARALITKPKILIFDDSTSAVDAETEGTIQDALNKLMKGTTTFIVAQRISSVLNADTIFLMEKGEIISRGTHKELLESSPIYREIYTSQLGGDLDE